MSAQTKSTHPVQPGVNLLPPEVHQRRAARKVRAYLLLAIGVVLALVVVGVLWADGKVREAEDRLQAAEDEHADLLAEEATYWEVPIVLAELKNAENAETLAMWRDILWEPYALEIVDALPDDVIFEWYAVQSPGAIDGSLVPNHPFENDAYAWIQFEGYVATRPDAAEWMESIEAIKGFENAYIEFVELEGDADEADSSIYSFKGDVDVTIDALSGRYLPDSALDSDEPDEAEDETAEEDA